MKQLKEAVVVAYGRSPVARAFKGSFAGRHPVEYAAQVLNGVLDRVPQLAKADIDDVIVGCAKPEGVQGVNVARMIAQRAALPDGVPGQTVNRLCSSGLQAIATAANAIAVGQADVVVAGGVEDMSDIPMASDPAHRNTWLLKNTQIYTPMGVTAENVAERYHLERAQLDALAAESHRRAYAAQTAGKFDDEIIPVTFTDEAGASVTSQRDEGVRAQTTVEGLSGLKAVFKENGVVTAGTSSQLSDGAAFVVLMSEEKARELGIQPIAKLKAFAVTGLAPEVMGLGPITAVPKALERAELTLEDIEVIELNEAFAAQAIPCMEELKLDPEKVNPNGGAMALGHPLGATGAILTCKLLSELKRTGGTYGMVTMCIGGGMGAAGVFEMVKGKGGN